MDDRTRGNSLRVLLSLWLLRGRNGLHNLAVQNAFLANSFPWSLFHWNCECRILGGVFALLRFGHSFPFHVKNL
uniref:Uncharacterized protein n=1 Tax=Anguilla anguilla TaxID=7936 RepID=A0A0E9WJK7_ANGAN